MLECLEGGIPGRVGTTDEVVVATVKRMQVILPDSEGTRG